VKKGIGLACCRPTVWGNLLGNCDKSLSANHSRLGPKTGR
jgi:hypothetical protein